MLKELLELKKLGATGIKLEFESEYFSENEAFEFSELVHRVGLDFCVKLGGVSSIQDLHSCKILCANSIVAPIVESAYSVEKFLKCVNQVYGESFPKLFINIETLMAFKNLDEILEKCDERISGFVLGRSDLKNSLQIENANDTKILEYCQKLSKICEQRGKLFIIGGKIDSSAVDFVSQIPYISCIETRKVIFDYNKINKNALVQALEFELKCLKSKKTCYTEDLSRIKFLENSI